MEMEQFKIEFGQRIKAKREEAKLTQTELANKVGYSENGKGIISKIENGKVESRHNASQVLTAIYTQDTNTNKKIPGQPVLTGHPGFCFFAPINNNFYHVLIIRPFFCVLQRF